MCKYYFVTNLLTLRIEDTKRTIEKLSDSLHLPFHLANVTRIDFGTNLIMEHELEIYFPYLGQLRYYKKLEHDNGLYLRNSKRELVFYDKTKEQKRKISKCGGFPKNCKDGNRCSTGSSPSTSTNILRSWKSFVKVYILTKDFYFFLFL